MSQEAPPQDDVCTYSNRYVDNLNDSSPPLHFSVFGRPLLPGDFSGRGGTTGNEDLVSVRMAENDSRGRGRDLAGVTLVFEEEYEEADRRTEEAQQDPSETVSYDRWGSSCLIKFSEFLGFSTKGFEKEILDLLRNLVARQKNGKEKGNMSVSKSDRELRRLKSTINYNGKQTNRGGGGRDEGNIQIKL